MNSDAWGWQVLHSVFGVKIGSKETFILFSFTSTTENYFKAFYSPFRETRSKISIQLTPAVTLLVLTFPLFPPSNRFYKGNGLIDETEFLQWIARIQALRETETTAEDDDLTQDLVAAFRWELLSIWCVKAASSINSFRRVFDRDNNGYITLDELQRAMQMIGENVTDAQLNEMLALADLDKDGRINYEGELVVFAKISLSCTHGALLFSLLLEFARLLL